MSNDMHLGPKWYMDDYESWVREAMVSAIYWARRFCWVSIPVPGMGIILQVRRMTHSWHPWGEGEYGGDDYES